MSWHALARAAGGVAVALLCAVPSRAAAAQSGPVTIRAKCDMRLWETVHDRSAPLAWTWRGGADSATVLFSNRVTRSAWSAVVPRNGAEMRGSCAQPAPTAGETVIDVALVQMAGANEVARETATLAYVAGAGGGPITVRANPGARTWTLVREPRVYAVDPAWQGESGDSGYDVAWPDRRGLVLILK